MENRRATVRPPCTTEMRPATRLPLSDRPSRQRQRATAVTASVDAAVRVIRIDLPRSLRPCPAALAEQDRRARRSTPAVSLVTTRAEAASCAPARGMRGDVATDPSRSCSSGAFPPLGATGGGGGGGGAAGSDEGG